MPFDGSGNFTRSYNFVQDKTNGIKIVASRMDGEFDNFATAMNQAFLRNGLVPMTGSLNMGTNTINSLGDGTVGTPAIRFNSDPTTGIYVPGYGKVALTAGGTKRLEANSGGVDTTGLLTISSSGNTAGVRLSNTVAARDYRLLQKDAGYFALTDETAGQERLIVYNTGNAMFSQAVGINGWTPTANSVAKLSVAGDVFLPGANRTIGGNLEYVSTGYKYGGNGYGWLLREDGAGKLQVQYAGNNVSGAGAAATTFISTTWDLANGRVGIGTPSPSQALHVQGNILAIPPAGWTSGQTAAVFVGDTTNGITSTNGGYTSLIGFGGISFPINGTEAARIDGNRNLMVGTTGEWTGGFARLTGQTNASGGRAVSAYNNATTGSAILARVDNTNVALEEWYYQSGTSVGTLKTDGTNLLSYAANSHLFHAGGIERQRILNTGEIGMGMVPTVGATSRLQVAGDIGLINSGAQSLHYNGYFGSGSWRYGTTGQYSGALRFDGTTGDMQVWTSSASGAAGAVSNISVAAVFDRNGGLTVNNAATINGLITARGSALFAGIRLSNSIANRDQRLMQKDDGRIVLSDESAGAERLVVNVAGQILEGGTNFELGYKDAPQNSQAGSYTLALTDRGRHLYLTSGAATITVPLNASVAFPLGTIINVLNDGSASKTISPAGGVNLKWVGSGTSGARTLAVSGLATLIKVASDTWYINGVGLS